MDNESLYSIIKKSNNIVFFGGAGVSTESGIPDFRSAKGIFNENYQYPPEIIISRSFFSTKTEIFYEFYKSKLIFPKAKPNGAHVFLSRLEEIGKLKAIITQNIDGLHQMAGSKNVLELHGSIHRNYCMSCNKFYKINDVLESEGIPYCECGGVIKPDIVLYEEALNNKVLQDAVGYISNADALIIGGTSLAVYPAAGLIDYYRGNKLILINKSDVPNHNKVNFTFRGDIAEILEDIDL